MFEPAWFALPTISWDITRDAVGAHVITLEVIDFAGNKSVVETDVLVAR